MPSIQWVTPAARWGSVSATLASADLRRPLLLKLAGDDFLPAFLDAMEGRNPEVGAIEFLADEEHDFCSDEDTVKATRLEYDPGSGKNVSKEIWPYKLYHPAHSRYYLALGSLVCRQTGLPDRPVKRESGESAAFVIRRRVLVDGELQEQGWVDEGPQRGWRALRDDKGNLVNVRPDEERLPMHAVRARLAANGGAAPNVFQSLAGDERTLYYGYLPVGNREKYLDRRPVAEATPAAAVKAFEEQVRATSTADQDYDFRLDEVTTRVTALWGGILDPLADPPDRLDDPAARERAPTVALYLVLDLGDWLDRTMPEVLAAIQGGPAVTGERKKLVDEVNKIWIGRQPGGPGIVFDESKLQAISLATAIKDLSLAGSLDLVRGIGAEPQDFYDLRDAQYGSGTPSRLLQASDVDTLHDRLSAALGETTHPAEVSGEVLDLLKNQVTLEPPDAAVTAEGLYFLRLVYDYPPCSPIVSAESQPFILARYFDPDAPARKIRIQLPSVAMKDLRKYKHGVGMEMSPDLRDIMNRVQKSMLKDEGLKGDSGGWELGMICSFSLQIIFLVAFIVMFIFLILLNIIFWWLPFLKICFPIPVKKGG